MTKQEFCNYINMMRNAWDFDLEQHDLARKHGIDFSETNTSFLMEGMADLLDQLFCHCKPGESGDVSYFVFELDFGRTYQPGDVTEVDDNGEEVEIDFSTAEKLYDYLTANRKS